MNMGDYLPGTLQDRLKELREKHKLTQAQVARALGISQSSYGRIEKGTITYGNVLRHFAILPE